VPLAGGDAGVVVLAGLVVEVAGVVAAAAG
jgi:hypothetical protein